MPHACGTRPARTHAPPAPNAHRTPVRTPARPPEEDAIDDLLVADDAAALLPGDALAALRDPRTPPRCAVCGVLVEGAGAAVAVTDGERILAVVTHPGCRVSGVAMVDRDVLDGSLAEASTSRTHLAIGPAGHPVVLVTTVHAGRVDGADAAVPVLLAAGMQRQPGLPTGPLEVLHGWDATVHPDGLLEVTGPRGQVFVAGSPGPPPGGARWWTRAAADGHVVLLYVGGVHGDAGLTVEDVEAAAARDELVGGGVRWRDRSGGHR